jgi:hypothetical protein
MKAALSRACSCVANADDCKASARRAPDLGEEVLMQLRFIADEIDGPRAGGVIHDDNVAAKERERTTVTTAADVRVQLDRRAVIRSVAGTTLAVAAHGIGSDATADAATTRRSVSQPQGDGFWPNNARLAITRVS